VAARKLFNGNIILTFETPEGKIQQKKEKIYLKIFG